MLAELVDTRRAAWDLRLCEGHQGWQLDTSQAKRYSGARFRDVSSKRLELLSNSA